jgi:hypothetical protein
LPTQIPVSGDRKTIDWNPFDILPSTNPFDIPLLDTLPIHSNARPPTIPVNNTKPKLSGPKPYVLVPQAQPVTKSNEPLPPVKKSTPPRTASSLPRTAPAWVKRVPGLGPPGRKALETVHPPDANDMDIDSPKNGSSDIKGELEVADTPTSSQEALGAEDTSGDEGDRTMDTSDDEVVVHDGRYTPRTIDEPNDPDIPVTSSLQETGIKKGDWKGKRKAVESGDAAEDLQGAGLNVVNPVDNLEAPSSGAPEGTSGAMTSGSGRTSGSGGIASGSGLASGSGSAPVPIPGAITHPADLMGEIEGMLAEEKITTESIQANFQQLVCFFLQ